MKIGKFLLYLLLIIFPLGQIVRFKLAFLPASVTLHPLDIISFFFVINWLTGIKKGKIPFFSKAFILFFSAALLSFLFNMRIYGTEILASSFYLLRLANWSLFAWAMTDFLKISKLEINKLIIWSTFAIAVFSILQYLFLPDVRFLFYSGWDDHLYRAIGTFLDPAFTGILLVLGIILALSKFFDKKYLGKDKLWLISSVVILFISISLTFSRMSYLLLMICLTLLFIMYKKYKYLIAIVLVFAVLVTLLPKPTGEGVDLLRKSTGISKLANYQQISLIIKDNLFLGVGYNNLRFEYLKRGFISRDNWEENHSGAGADNSFLFVLATTGIFGLLLYLNTWLVIFRKAINHKGSPSTYLLVIGSTLTISAFFVNSLFYPWILCLWGILLADFTAGIDR